MTDILRRLFEIIPAPLEDLLIMMFVIAVGVEVFAVLLYIYTWWRKNE